MAVGDIIKVTFSFAVDQKGWENTIHYEVTAGDQTASSMQAFAGYLNGLMISKFANIQSDQVNFTGTTVLTIEGTFPIPGRIQNDTLVIGSTAGDMMPLNAAAVIQLRTNAPSGRQNGRVFFSGLPESEIENGILGAIAISLLTTIGEAFAEIPNPATLEGLEYKPVVLQRVAAGVPVVPPIAHDVVSTFVPTTIYNQRKRLRKSRQMVASP